MGPSERDGKAERDRCVVRKGPPCPWPMGTDNWGGGEGQCFQGHARHMELLLQTWAQVGHE